MRDLQIEMGLDLGMGRNQRLKRPPVEPVDFELADGPHRGAAPAAMQQRHLAETVALAQRIEQHLVAALPLADRLRAPRSDHIKRIRLIAFDDDGAAESVRLQDEALRNPLLQCRRKRSE